MAFAKVDLDRTEPSLPAGLLDACRLGRSAWSSNTGAFAVLVHCAGEEPHDFPWILLLGLLANRVRDAMGLQDDGRPTLTTTVAVGGVVEGKAAATARNHAPRAHGNVCAHVHHDTDAVGDGHVGATHDEVVVGHGCCCQGRRARSVDDGIPTSAFHPKREGSCTGITVHLTHVAGVAYVEGDVLSPHILPLQPCLHKIHVWDLHAKAATD
mmetsp:Transcript_30146/g.64155  ORF Transcript_30146/g.64155 Transcript_30146/m.64155 type:complete len:211 (-) Transcript_30146:1427-2059(-)